MKYLGYIILAVWLLFELVTLACAAIVPLAWDVVPEAQSYRIFRGIWVVGTSFTNKATVDLPAGATTLTVTAVNFAGESEHSESITVYVPPPPIVTVQFSADLADWQDDPFPEARFYRAKIETP